MKFLVKLSDINNAYKCFIQRDYRKQGQRLNHNVSIIKLKIKIKLTKLKSKFKKTKTKFISITLD